MEFNNLWTLFLVFIQLQLTIGNEAKIVEIVKNKLLEGIVASGSSVIKSNSSTNTAKNPKEVVIRGDVDIDDDSQLFYVFSKPDNYLDRTDSAVLGIYINLPQEFENPREVVLDLGIEALNVVIPRRFFLRKSQYVEVPMDGVMIDQFFAKDDAVFGVDAYFAQLSGAEIAKSLVSPHKTPYMILRPKVVRQCGSCCLKDVLVDVKEMGFNFIIAPSRFRMAICTDDCGNNNNEVKPLSRFARSEQASTFGECSATGYTPLQIAYMDSDNKAQVSKLNNVIATGCGCA